MSLFSCEASICAAKVKEIGWMPVVCIAMAHDISVDDDQHFKMVSYHIYAVRGEGDAEQFSKHTFFYKKREWSYDCKIFAAKLDGNSDYMRYTRFAQVVKASEIIKLFEEDAA